MSGSNAVVEFGTHAAKSRTRPIDIEHLERQTLGDGGLQAEVLRMFDELMTRTFAKLEASTSVPELMVHLKTLRAGAAGIGAFGLSELAGMTEDELNAGVAVNPERVDDLQMAVEEVSTFIAFLLGQLEA